MDANTIVSWITAPLVLVLTLLAIAIHRYGSRRFALGIITSWLAVVALSFEPSWTVAAVFFGASTPALLLAAGLRYADLPLTPRRALLLAGAPVLAATVEATIGEPWGELSMATSDTLLLGLTAWVTIARPSTPPMLMTRLLPASVVAFVPVNLYYQAQAITGGDMSVPTMVQSLALVLLSSMYIFAISARVVREETLARERLERRLERQSSALAASEAKAQAAERLASVGTLAAGIAHQINNPIGGILAAAQFELGSLGETERTAATGPWKTLRTIEGEALRCARIVRDILFFARGEPGPRSRQDLNALVAAAVDATREPAKRRGASIVIEPSADPIPVEVNDVEIEQALVNLITNAAESGDDVRITIGAGRSGAEAVCWIEDDGPGVPPEIRDRIFDPFFSTKHRAGGSGLGLSVVHGIVHVHGGRIEVEDVRPGGGARFRVTLPLDVGTGNDAR